MQFGLDKCATAIFKDGKLTKNENISLNNRTVTRNMEHDETYKYLGIEEGDSIDNSQMQNKLMKEYYLKVWQILKAELNSKRKITAINTLAVPVLVYCFGIGNWLRNDFGKIARKTRKLVTIEGIQHLMADISRLYIKRQNGGLD
jgi:hypothetical protein